MVITEGIKNEDNTTMLVLRHDTKNTTKIANCEMNMTHRLLQIQQKPHPASMTRAPMDKIARDSLGGSAGSPHQPFHDGNIPACNILHKINGRARCRYHSIRKENHAAKPYTMEIR